MNRYENTFAELKRRGRIAFIPFAVAGDPEMKTSAEVFRTFIRAGADILEIGYPFSDPIADGPVNQRASQRAIAAGFTPSRFFALIRQLRAETEIPFGLLAYTNTVLHLGFKRFCSLAASSGLDSILIADMPPEESHEFLRAMKLHGLRSVFIVSELTPAERIRSICAHTDGFIYVVSRLGTTGVQKDFSSSVRETIARLRRVTTLPLCVGFGISSPRHVAKVRDAGADGAIVGSRLVNIIEEGRGHVRTMLPALESTVRRMKTATISSGRKTAGCSRLI